MLEVSIVEKCGKKCKHNNKYHGYTIYIYIYVWRDRANKIPRKHTLAGIARAKENAMDDFPFSIFCALQWNFLVVAMLNFLFAVTTRPLPSFSFDFELCIRRSKVSQKKINCQLLFILLLTLHYLLDLMSGGTTTVNIFFGWSFRLLLFFLLVSTFVLILYVRRIFILF